MKRKINIVVSKAYPKVHRRHGEPTGFASMLVNGDKLHTIRNNYDMWAVNAEKMRTGRYLLAVRQWEGIPRQSKQCEVYNTDECIGVERIHMMYSADNDSITIHVEDRNLSSEEVALLVKNEGMNLDDFIDWFFWRQRNKHDAVYNGVIVHFSDFRYNQ